MPKPKLLLVHWNQGEAYSNVSRLRVGGWDADCAHTSVSYAVSSVGKKTGGVVIYLSRMPTRGREVARRLRSDEATSSIPLIFVDGSEADQEKAREIAEDAEFTTHDDLIDTANSVAGDS